MMVLWCQNHTPDVIVYNYAYANDIFQPVRSVEHVITASFSIKLMCVYVFVSIFSFGLCVDRELLEISANKVRVVPCSEKTRQFADCEHFHNA